MSEHTVSAHEKDVHDEDWPIAPIWPIRDLPKFLVLQEVLVAIEGLAQCHMPAEVHDPHFRQRFYNLLEDVRPIAEYGPDDPELDPDDLELFWWSFRWNHRSDG